ncbi:MAG: secreted PhoX family phosphatase [Planctomycetota bacterium]|jgi:secreted PhoX family phosphatase
MQRLRKPQLDGFLDEQGNKKVHEKSEIEQAFPQTTRREALKIAMSGVAALLLPTACRSSANPNPESAEDIGLIGFESIPASTDDVIHMAPGYEHRVLYAWGDPVNPSGPQFEKDASNPAKDQWQQAGTHHDGMEFFSVDGSSDHGYLVLNHESFDDNLIHKEGTNPPSKEKSLKGMSACGVSVIEVKRDEKSGEWERVESRLARRITAASPTLVQGPAAGHVTMQTSADPQGKTVLGTFGNCAAGKTPWGTYLTCEENFQDFFKLPAVDKRPSKAERRYMTDAYLMNQWHLFDQRFDYNAEPNEFNRFGWVVEIDPLNKRPPTKRTALGRFRHENAGVTLSKDNHVVVYMGDDARFEYVYKFVSTGKYDPDDHSNVSDLLDRGTLYAGQFLEEGKGQWVELTHGKNGLDAKSGFPDQATVVINARLAADHVGATNMDRPEWLVVHEERGEVYASLTNNDRRGLEGQPGPNPANPRAQNYDGQIVRWTETGGDAAATSFDWNIFQLCGEAEDEPRYSSPDGMHIDSRGLLWVQTDVSSGYLNSGRYEGMGNNQMIAVDPHSGESRRFMTGPVRCEITGVTTTPDGKTLFVNVQHPGQPSTGTDPNQPDKYSNWPDGETDEVRSGRPQCGRPRSATLVIQRSDGGIVGAS